MQQKQRPPNSRATLTHRSGGHLWGMVVDVSHGDKGCGRVRQPKVEVAFHVSGLNDDGVLRHSLQQRAHTS